MMNSIFCSTQNGYAYIGKSYAYDASWFCTCIYVTEFDVEFAIYGGWKWIMVNLLNLTRLNHFLKNYIVSDSAAYLIWYRRWFSIKTMLAESDSIGNARWSFSFFTNTGITLPIGNSRQHQNNLVLVNIMLGLWWSFSRICWGFLSHIR